MLSHVLASAKGLRGVLFIQPRSRGHSVNPHSVNPHSGTRRAPVLERRLQETYDGHRIFEGMPLRAMLRKLFPQTFRPSSRPSTALLERFPLASYFPVAGMPGRPRWEELYLPLQEGYPDHHEDVWWEVGRFWVERLKQQLGPEFFLLESYDCLLLSCLPPKRAQFLLSNTETILQRMESLLGTNALQRGSYGPHLMLCFADSHGLHEYLVEFEDDSESMAPAAVFIPGGCGHIAMYGDDLRMLEPTLVHELTHAMLWHLGLPLWLEEGVAQVLPQLVVHSRGIEINRDLVEEQQEVWGQDGLRGFWDGSAFRCPRRSEAAYNLGEVLVRSMLSRKGVDFQGFLASASWRDCGQGASRECLKYELTDLVRDFLGPDVSGLQPPSSLGASFARS